MKPKVIQETEEKSYETLLVEQLFKDSKPVEEPEEVVIEAPKRERTGL